MNRLWCSHYCIVGLTIVVAGWAAVGQAQVVNSEWNVGNGNWNAPANWFPNDVPDNGGGFTYDVEIGNRPVAAGAQVTFVPEDGTSDTITSLTISTNADLLTNANQLVVLGQTTIDGVGTTIRVDPHATPGTTAFQSLNVDLNNGGGLTMSGGIATVSAQLEINVGSVLGGHGTVNLGDADGVVEQSFENSGLLQVQGNTAAPQTLTLHANGVDTIDLDGDSELGVVDVSNALANVNADTVTLVIDGPLADGFGAVAGGATLQIGQRDTVTFNNDFEIDAGATITMDGGNNVATLNGPGAITDIADADFTITGAGVIANNMTFSGTANTITLNNGSSLTLNGTVTIPDASAISRISLNELIVTGSTTISEVAGDFDWDGGGAATTTVSGSGALTINVDQVDTVGNDVFNGALNLNDNGDLSVNVTAGVWQMGGTLNKNNAGTSTVAGDAVNVTGAITVNAGSLTMPVTTLNPTASIVANGTLLLGSSSVFAGPGSVTGTGTLRMVSTSTVTANTTIGAATFDWDGTSAGSLQTIDAGVIFTINSTTFDSDGDMDDPISLAGNGGQLIVNGMTNWTMAAALTTNPAAVGTATIGGASRMSLAGASASWAVTGSTTANAPVTFGSSSTTIAALRTLRLAGGDNNLNTNVMAGGTIGGPGTLAANDARELQGFGTINASIDFDDTARLRADNGTLTITGAIVDVGVIGTADGDGVLNVVNAWNNNVAAGVALLGGTVQGGTITNDSPNGIQGFGTVTSRVINNTQLLSFNGGTLIFQTAGNDNDWDGGANAGMLRATNGTTLELRDNATFGFTGSVQANPGGHVFTNGFALDFNPGSTINLGAGMYQSTSSTDIGGTVTVGAGAASTIKVQNNFFLTFEPTSVTTLNANLRLENNNIGIDAGATFSGTGALIVPDGSHMVIDNGATVNVLLVNEGGLRPANSEGVGTVTVKDYSQTSTGELFVEMIGSLPNQFDRIQATGVTQVDGLLHVDLDEVSPGNLFNPALGTTFDIISTVFGVSGQFDLLDYSNLPAGKTFHVDYLANAVRLTVVNRPFFSADFDDDGDVDTTDYSIWRGAFDLNQLGDANGDNITDASDWVLWRDQFGSVPGAGAFVDVSGAAVPEPGTFVLMGLIAAGCLAVRRRRSIVG